MWAELATVLEEFLFSQQYVHIYIFLLNQFNILEQRYTAHGGVEIEENLVLFSHSYALQNICFNMWPKAERGMVSPVIS